MKKLLASLLVVVMVLSLVFVFVGCDSDALKKLTYTDANGNEQSINIKKTSDADQVTASIMALANKEVDTTSLSNLLVSLTASGSVSGTQNDIAFTDNVSANITLGAAFPADVTDKKLSELLAGSQLYANASVSGKLPKNLFADEEDKVLTFNDTMDINESATLYVDQGVIYAKGQLSETTKTALADYSSLIEKIDGKYGKYDASAMLSMIDLAVGGNDASKQYVATGASVLRDSKNSYVKVVTKIADLLDKDDDDDDSETTAEETAEPEFEFTYANVKTIVQALNIKITKTKGSKVTFTADINKDSIKALNAAFGDAEDPDENIDEDYDGSVHLELVLDAKTMLDCTLTATANKIAEYIADEDDFPGITFTDSSVSLTLSISTAAIPTISQADADSATEIGLADITSLMSLM